MGTLFFSGLNLISAYYIILTRGVGKNGSTVAVSVCVCASLASGLLPSFYCWGEAQNEVLLLFFYDFVFLETRVGYRSLFSEALPKVVHAWGSYCSLYISQNS